MVFISFRMIFVLIYFINYYAKNNHIYCNTHSNYTLSRKIPFEIDLKTRIVNDSITLVNVRLRI